MAAMPALGDEVGLARAAAAGDGQAFAALYDAYEARIFTFCHRLVGSPEDAADATQDAFLKVLQRLPKLEGRELNFGAYLFTAARNASYDVIGRRKRAEPVDEIPEHGARPVTGDEGGDIFVDPERAALLGSLQESVQSANARLPERQREVLALRELEDMSYDEIAEILQMNRNSVAQLISRARIKLRDELRGSALASVAASSAECERALPLIAMRQDGQLKDPADREWLVSHLVDCPTCKVGVDAMEEAGLSYRAWLPIVPLIWLREATVAKAAELTGSDWSDVIAAGRAVGAGAGGAAAGVAGSAESALAAEPTGNGRPRRRVLEAVGGLLLLLILFGALVAGLQDNTPSETVDPAAAAETVPATTAETAPTRPRTRTQQQAGATTPTVTGSPTTETIAATTSPAKAPAKPRTRRRSSPGSGVTTTGGEANTGGDGTSRPPLTGTTTTPPPPPTTTTPPATETTPPTATTPPTRPTPPPTSTPPPSTCPPNDPACRPIP
jgi:RNA polymerase sigma-70 factor (ECF subfamily)